MDNNYGKQAVYEMSEWFNAITKGDADKRMKHEHHEAFNDVLDKAGDLINSLKKMRDLYKKDDFLPLYHVNSEYEDLMTMLSYIEDEILMFGEPVHVNKEYIGLTNEEIKELKDNPMGDWEQWIEEELI